MLFRSLAVAPYAGPITSDERKLALVMRKMKIEGRFIDAIKEMSVNCHGQFEAESTRDSSLIMAKEVPPTRTFFRCKQCTTRYEPSINIQEVLDLSCSATTETKAPITGEDGLKYAADGISYSLDPSNGLIRDKNGTLITDAELVRHIWERYIGSLNL